MLVKKFPVLVSVLYLAACNTPTAPDSGEADSGQARADVSEPPLPRVRPDETAVQRERMLADLLYEGLQALDADRLLTPADDNAHARFKRVLAYDPDNEIALQGLQEIVLRYAELAEEAASRGLFDRAEVFLDRARFVNAGHPAIADAQSAVASERQSGDLFFELNPSAVQQRSEALRDRLESIARTAREHEAFILISAPSDLQARWIYSTMREAVNGHRLRGNIELAGSYSIRLRIAGD